MEVVLEQHEVIELLREALKARGLPLSRASVIRLRRNNKKGTLRVVIVSPSPEDGSDE